MVAIQRETVFSFRTVLPYDSVTLVHWPIAPNSASLRAVSLLSWKRTSMETTAPQAVARREFTEFYLFAKIELFGILRRTLFARLPRVTCELSVVGSVGSIFFSANTIKDRGNIDSLGL